MALSRLCFGRKFFEIFLKFFSNFIKIAANLINFLLNLGEICSNFVMFVTDIIKIFGIWGEFFGGSSLRGDKVAEAIHHATKSRFLGKFAFKNAIKSRYGLLRICYANATQTLAMTNYLRLLCVCTDEILYLYKPCEIQKIHKIPKTSANFTKTCYHYGIKGRK